MPEKINIYKHDYTKCNNCHKCMLRCGVKAIKSVNGHVVIQNSRCIGCGHCMEVCPQNCKTYRSDLDKVKEMIANGDQVYLSLDPSYPGIFEYDDPAQLGGALSKLGFFQVREASEGAEYVTMEYERMLREGKMDNIITTTCPSTVTLIEKHYPELVPYMAPVVSHIVAHAKLIKRVKGDNVKVVYAGPCLSRSVEKIFFSDDIDGVLGFQDIEAWFEEEGIVIKECEPKPFNNPDPMINQLYAIAGGIIRTLNNRNIGDDYEKISVSGVSNCRELLHSIKRGYIHHTFIELHVCEGGCVNGPCIDKRRGFRYKATIELERSSEKTNPPIRHEIPGEDLQTEFFPHPVNDPVPTEEEIQEMMEVLGNVAHSRPLNCGACGYETCREKAISMCNGNSEKTTCLMYSYEKARSMSNLVLDVTPNIIMVIDPHMHIVEFNSRAESVFKISRNEALKLYLFDLIDASDYEDALTYKQSIRRKRKYLKEQDMTVLETIIYIPETGHLLTIIEDVSAEVKEREKAMNGRLETVNIAQQIIDKQMTTAQQIAGLLGETTAETKAILYKLQKYLLDDEEI